MTSWLTCTLPTGLACRELVRLETDLVTDACLARCEISILTSAMAVRYSPDALRNALNNAPHVLVLLIHRQLHSGRLGGIG